MRLICPNCMQAVTTADTEAGKSVACPNCSHSFVAPQMYAPPPAPEPAPPPAVVKPVVEPSPTTTEPAPAPAPATTSAFRHEHFASLNRRVCVWLAPICLSLVFLLTFFKWVGFYPAGYSAYSQNAWQTLFADISVDPVSEKEFHKEKELYNALHASWWLLPYLLLLFVGVPLSWGDHVLNAAQVKLPARLEGIWRHRQQWIAACAGLTLFFIIIQWAAGFGLTNALTGAVEEDYKEQLDKAKTPEEIQRVEMLIAIKKAEFYPRTTIWLRLAIVLHILAVAGIAGETVLIHRGDKPAPRVGVMW